MPSPRPRPCRRQRAFPCWVSSGSSGRGSWLCWSSARVARHIPSIEEGEEVLERDLAGKAQQAVLHRRRQKARYYGCLPLPIPPSVRAQGLPKATLVGDFLGPGHRGRRFSSRSPEGGPETIYPDGLLGRGTAEPIGVDLLLGPASLAQELLVHQLPARESLRLALEDLHRSVGQYLR